MTRKKKGKNLGEVKVEGDKVELIPGEEGGLQFKNGAKPKKEGIFSGIRKKLGRNKYKKLVQTIKDIYKKKPYISLEKRALLNTNQEEHQKRAEEMSAEQLKTTEPLIERQKKINEMMTEVKAEANRLGEEHTQQAMELDIEFMEKELKILKEKSTA